jgi:hypothetical protein
MPQAPRAHVPLARLTRRLSRFWIAMAMLGATLGLSLPLDRAAREESRSIPDELLVGFHADVTRREAEAVYAPLRAVRIEEIAAINVHRLPVAPAEIERVERALGARPEVAFVERNLLLGGDQTAPTTVARPDELLVGVDPETSSPRGRSISAEMAAGNGCFTGTYTFPAGSVAAVRVNDASGRASADAVRFVLAP